LTGAKLRAADRPALDPSLSADGAAEASFEVAAGVAANGDIAFEDDATKVEIAAESAAEVSAAGKPFEIEETPLGTETEADSVAVIAGISACACISESYKIIDRSSFSRSSPLKLAASGNPEWAL
jgi:hypothetical protein